MRTWRLGLMAFVGLAAAAMAETVIRRGNISEPETLDPHHATGNWENAIIGDLFLGLMTDDAAAQPVPGVAERWTVSPDGLTWVFNLRKDSVWSDGVPVKASDFVFGFRRLLDPKTAAKYASLQYGIKNAIAVNTGKAPVNSLGVRAIDDHTLEIVTETPLPYLLGLLTHYTAFALPEHIVAKHGETWTLPGKMVSNGAYMLDQWEPHSQIKVVKNPKFFDASTVAIDTVYYYPIEDENAALMRFRSREIDANIGPRGFPINELPWLKANMPRDVHVVPQLATDYLVTNMRRKPWDDPRIRAALSLALDRETVTSRVNRDGRLPAYALVPPGIANYATPPKVFYADWPKDKRQAEARRLLAEAGYGPKNPLRFEYNYMTGRDPRRQAIAEASLWAEIGIVAKPVANEPKVHYNMLQEHDFDVAIAAWVADYDDPQNFLYLVDSRSTGFNYPGYNNPAFDKLMDQAAMTLDMKARADILAEAERVMLADHAVIPVAYRTAKMLVADYVKGFEGNGKNVHRTRWMRIEGRP